MLHADCWFGLDGGNIVWNNYETRHYYFPVQFREGLDRPDSFVLQEIGLVGLAGAEEGRRMWEDVLERHHASIDVVVAWKREPGLDAVTARWFELTNQIGDLRIFRPRVPPATAP